MVTMGAVDKVLQERRCALAEASDQLEKLRRTLTSSTAPDVDHLQSTLNEIRVVKSEIAEALAHDFVQLDDGRPLWRTSFESLKRFAQLNGITTDDVLQKTTIVRGRVIACSMSFYIKTLEGLHELDSLRKLEIASSPGLVSLRHLPTQSLEELTVTRCGLRGDLVELQAATGLRRLRVSWNPGLTSLRGAPIQSLEELDASWCGLTGDLHELRGATALTRLSVIGNRALCSLEGIALPNLCEVKAQGCGLNGDLSALRGATGLRQLVVRSNPLLTSLEGLSTESLQYVDFEQCDISGDLAPLQGATQLEQLYASRNKELRSLKGIPTAKLRIVDIRGCTVQGDLSILAEADNLEEVATDVAIAGVSPLGRVRTAIHNLEQRLEREHLINVAHMYGVY